VSKLISKYLIEAGPATLYSAVPRFAQWFENNLLVDKFSIVKQVLTGIVEMYNPPDSALAIAQWTVTHLRQLANLASGKAFFDPIDPSVDQDNEDLVVNDEASLASVKQLVIRLCIACLQYRLPDKSEQQKQQEHLIHRMYRPTIKLILQFGSNDNSLIISQAVATSRLARLWRCLAMASPPEMKTESYQLCKEIEGYVLEHQENFAVSLILDMLLATRYCDCWVKRISFS